MKPQVTQPQWLSLPSETRRAIVKTFNLPRSGGTITSLDMGGPKVSCDGHLDQDLAHLSVERMQAYVGSKDQNPWTLLEAVAEKIELATPENISKDESVLDKVKKCCGSKGARHKKGCVKAKA
jgi:hypothetical protein